MGKKASPQNQQNKKEEKPAKPAASEPAKEPVIAPVVEPVKNVKDSSKESITAKNEALLEFFQKLSMKGAGSTSENNTVKNVLYDSVLVSVDEIERKVKRGATEEKVSFITTRSKGIEANSICLVDMTHEFEGFISKKFTFFIDSLSSIIERLNAFKKEHDITLFHEAQKIVLKDMQTGIRSWINNETKDFAAIKKKIEESNFNETFGYTLVEKDGLKYLVSEKQKMNSGFVVNASLFKQVFSHCSILKFYLIPIELKNDSSGKYLRLAIETDTGGFDKEFRDKKEITFFGPEKEISAMYGIGLDSICNIAGNANLSCTYASDKFMFIYTELDDNTIIRMVIAPRVKEEPEEGDGGKDESARDGESSGADTEDGEAVSEETDDLEEALKEATSPGKDPEDQVDEEDSEEKALEEALK